MIGFEKIPDSGPQRGFTLVETMVVLALALILLTAGVPSFNQIIKNNRLVAQANALSGLMASARSEAITERAVVTVGGSGNGTAPRAAGDHLCGEMIDRHRSG